MAINKEMLDKLDALVNTAFNEYHGLLQKSMAEDLAKGDLAASDVVIGQGGTDGDALAPADTKGGLSGAPAAAPAMEKAVPPGFEEKDSDKDSEGAEDEADEKDADDSDDERPNDSEDDKSGDEGKEAPEPKEADEAEDKDGDGIEDDEDSDDGEAGPPEDPKEDDEDPEFDRKFEKSFYRFMNKINLTGDDVQKSEEPMVEGDEFVDALQKSVDDRLSKISKTIEDRFAKMEENMNKALATVEKMAKSPAASRKAVSGVTPILRKSAEEGAPETPAKAALSKTQILAQVLEMQKSGDKRIGRTTVAAIDAARTPEEVAEIVRPLGIAV
jgi:hypothetical protein